MPVAWTGPSPSSCSKQKRPGANAGPFSTAADLDGNCRPFGVPRLISTTTFLAFYSSTFALMPSHFTVHLLPSVASGAFVQIIAIDSVHRDARFKQTTMSLARWNG